MGGMTAAPDLKLALHNTVAMAVGSRQAMQADSVQTPQAPSATKQAIFGEASTNPNVPRMDDHAAVDGSTSTLPTPSGHRPENVQALTERYSTPWRFFRHHAMRAKRRLRKSNWHQDGTKEAANDEARAEFDKMDMKTSAAWADLRERLVQGDIRVLDHSATSHLFEDGQALSLWTSEAGASRLRSNTAPSRIVNVTPRRSVSEGHRRKSKDTQDQQPARSLPSIAPFLPIRQKYSRVDHPERTVFLQLPFNTRLTPKQVAHACRNAIGPSIIPKGAVEDAITRDQGLCVLRLKDLKLARILAQKTVTLEPGAKPVRVWPYPERAPQVFFSHMYHNGSQGLRYDAIHLSITHAVSNVRFHVRREPLGSKTGTTWVVAFEKPVKLLRFNVGIQNQDGKHCRIQFEPVILSNACSVCHKGHSALECDLLEAATQDELGVNPQSASYLDQVPRIK